MKASVREFYCPIDSIRIGEVPIPEPKAGEVKVRVICTTVNRTDLGVLTGKPYAMRLFSGFTKPRYPVTGTDFAGIIEAIGAEVSGFQVGDRVWGFEDNGAGTHGEYLCFSTKKAILPLPSEISFEEGVACAEAAHYAVNFINKVKLEPGMEVLVNGGTGAIGSAAIQILKSMGVTVTAVCFEKDLEKVQRLGPNRVVALEQIDFTKEDRRYDFVFDAVGKSRFSSCKSILKPRGIYISSELGPGWENVWLALAGKIYGQKKVIFPIPIDILESMKYIQHLAQEGKFKPLIDERKFHLSEAKEAFAYVASGQKIGNVILQMVR